MGVPFHIATIVKPQITYGIRCDNSDRPFDHSSARPAVLSHVSAEDLIDTPIALEAITPVKPLPLSSTPFTYIDDVDGLEILAGKLGEVDEIAVDLEANLYRSYQGLTCLMQISTRTEDFVVDTLKLHHKIGEYLGGVFSDPKKRKVMHGAYKDVFWMQRDFGVYVCNLFDTMLASKVLNLERNTLGHLLGHYCDVAADKQYQASDWRERPLPQEKVHYAREDTHYLLYIYDVMRRELAKSSVDPLLEVYQTSHEKCCAMYEKEVFDEESYKNIHGLEEAELKTQQQFDVVARLYKWRDGIAREKDESTGYVMPNKLLLKIAKKMPETREKLKSIIENHNNWLERKEQAIKEGRMIYPDHPLALDNTAQIFNIILPSIVQHQQKIMAQVANDDRARMVQQQRYNVVPVAQPHYQYNVHRQIYPPHLMTNRPIYCIPQPMYYYSTYNGVVLSS